jgi:hypothetical protein
MTNLTASGLSLADRSALDSRMSHCQENAQLGANDLRWKIIYGSRFKAAFPVARSTGTEM